MLLLWPAQITNAEELVAALAAVQGEAKEKLCMLQVMLATIISYNDIIL